MTLERYETPPAVAAQLEDTGPHDTGATGDVSSPVSAASAPSGVAWQLSAAAVLGLAGAAAADSSVCNSTKPDAPLQFFACYDHAPDDIRFVLSELVGCDKQDSGFVDNYKIAAIRDRVASVVDDCTQLLLVPNDSRRGYIHASCDNITVNDLIQATHPACDDSFGWFRRLRLCESMTKCWDVALDSAWSLAPGVAIHPDAVFATTTTTTTTPAPSTTADRTIDPDWQSEATSKPIPLVHWLPATVVSLFTLAAVGAVLGIRNLVVGRRRTIADSTEQAHQWYQRKRASERQRLLYAEERNQG